MKRVYKASNESQFEDVMYPAGRAKLKTKIEDYCTKITVTGTKKQFEKFDEIRGA